MPIEKALRMQSSIEVPEENCMNTIIIPAYEPGDELRETTDELVRSGDVEVLVVDDGSGPEFRKFFYSLDPAVLVIGYEENRGKGYAIKHALRYIEVRGWEPGTVVTADADGQHATADIFRVLKASEANPGKLVLGCRDFGAEVPLKSRFGNRITREVFAYVCGRRIRDTQTGLRAFRTANIPFMTAVSGDRYEYEMNVLMDWVMDGRETKELRIDTIYHDASNSCSHFNACKDSARIYGQILKRATPLLFALSSFASFLLDYVLFLFLLHIAGLSGAAWGLVTANVAARIISAVFNYSMNRMIVFRSQSPAPFTGAAYALLALLILTGNSAVLSLYGSVLGFAPAIAKILTELTLFIFSYIVQKHLIFKKSHPQGKEKEKVR